MEGHRAVSLWAWLILVPLCIAVGLPFAAMGLVAIVQMLAWNPDDEDESGF